MASRDGDSIFAQFSSLAEFGTSQMAKAQELARKHNAVTEVSPHGLFLSSRSSAANPEVLRANGITHVLSVCGRYEPVDASLAYRFHALPGKGAVKLEVIVDCLRFIEDALHGGDEQGRGTPNIEDALHGGDEKGRGTPNRVLLHGTFGQSRSAAIAVGYLTRHPLSRALVGVDAAHTCLTAARDCIDIDPDLLAAVAAAVAQVAPASSRPHNTTQRLPDSSPRTASSGSTSQYPSRTTGWLVAAILVLCIAAGLNMLPASMFFSFNGASEEDGRKVTAVAPLRVRPIGSGEFGRFIAGIVQGKTEEGRSYQVRVMFTQERQRAGGGLSALGIRGIPSPLIPITFSFLKALFLRRARTH